MLEKVGNLPICDVPTWAKFSVAIFPEAIPPHRLSNISGDNIPRSNIPSEKPPVTSASLFADVQSYLEMI